MIDRMKGLLSDYEVENNRYSMAVNHCHVADGRVDGLVAYTKDAFPEFAGGLIVREAGGRFTNIEGQSDILPTDRIFIAGKPNTYDRLLPLTRESIKEEGREIDEMRTR